ncbi:MAG: response regulator [Bacteroidales bacterium]|nr:response regulator [Bacteroidales bacterium]MCF8402776.1 response regulator [Bacteroidales bacterium]
MDLLGLKNKEIGLSIENIPLPFAKGEIIYKDNQAVDLRLDEVNTLFCKVARFNRDELQGQLLSKFSPDFKEVFDKDRIPEIDKKPDQIQYNFELFIESRNQWFDVFIVLFHRSKVNLIINDSSSDHIKLEQLKIQEEKFRGVYENATVGMYKAKADGEFILANNALLKILGYQSFDDIKGKKLQNQRVAINLPDDLDEILSEKDEIHGFESLWQTQSGDAVYMMESARVIRDKSGQLTFFEGSVEDISHKKIAETQINQLNNIFIELGTDPKKNISTIVKKTNEILNGYCTFYLNYQQKEDKITAFDSFNMPELLEINDITEGHVCYDAFHNLQAPPFVVHDLEQTEYFVSDPAIQNFDLRSFIAHPVQVNGKSPGSICVFDTKKRQFTETEKKIISTLAVSLALEHKRLFLENDLKEATREAKNANKAKSQFLANMSHEIRTPLNGIMGFSEMLISQETDERKQRMLKLIEESGQQLFRIINDIFDYSMIEAGKITLKESLFSPKKLVDETVAYYTQAAKKKGLNIIVNDEHIETQELYGDYVKLSQILVNIVSNAIKFTDEGSVFIISSTRQVQNKVYFKITVEDSGIGINPEQLENIFIEFEQLEYYLTKRMKGTGLGLAITKRLTDFLNGQINVESEPGKGSRFVVEIPFSTQSNHKSELIMENQSEKKESTGREIKILLAEDNEANQFLIKAITKSQKWDITVVDDGIQAVEAFKSDTFDLVLMDVQMPTMNGYEATKEIREYEKASGRHTPIIALTAYAMKSDKDLCIQAGMDDYISKPFKRQQFLDAITNTIDKFSV